MTQIRIAVASLIAVVTACAPPDRAPDGVTIDRLVALSDGDYVAGTYADGRLAPDQAGHRDLLTTVSVRGGDVTAAHVEVSNSVTAAPEVLALSPDGATAFVAERLGQRDPGDLRADDLPAGNRLFAIDVSDPSAPAVIAVATVADMPEALAVHPDGSQVAVVSNTPDASVLQLIPWTSDGFGDGARFDLARLGVTGHTEGPRGGVTASNVQWHPSGHALALNINTQNRVAFFTVDTPIDSAVTVRPWGAPVTTGVDPFVGRFTPDGRHYLTSDWGRNLTTTEIAERLPAQPSRISVIAVGDVDSGQPRVVGSAVSDKSAEGMAISPDGQFVATVNMRGTALPAHSPNFDEHASVSLLRLDGASGALTKIGDYPLTGVLPEGGTFDASGEYFVATVFEGRPGRAEGAGLQVYRVDPQSGLSPAQRVSLPHGVHHVAVG